LGNLGPRLLCRKKGKTMSFMMTFIDYWNRKVRNFTIWDVKLVQGASLALGLIVAKLFPQVVGISIWWFVAAVAICVLRPAYVMWIRDG